MKARSDLRVRPHLEWQLPTLCLTAIVAVGLVVGNPTSNASPSTVAGVVLVAAVTVAAGLVPWTRFAHRWQALMPLLSVVAVALMEFQAASVMPSVVLVGLVPVLWLVFEFGRTGTYLAVLSIGGLLIAAFLGDASLPSSGAGWAQFVMLPSVAVGLCLGARHVAERLRWKRQALEEQSALLESTLQLSYDRLLLVQALLDSVDAAIVGYDHNGEVILQNACAQDLGARAGVSLTEPGASRDRFLYLEDRVTPVPLGAEVITRAKRGEEVEPQTYWCGPPGDQVAAMISARQIHRRNGERFGAVVVGWEVTDIVEAVRVREEFLATVSHELRTPLTSIIGYQELIAEELDSQETRIATMLAVAQRNAAVLLSRVGQLLQVSGADELQIQPRPVDVSTLVHDAVAKHWITAKAAGIDLATEIEPGVGAHLDPAAWEQVIDNLVSNALKYTLPGGTVEVRLKDVGDAFAMHVVDTGIGMSRIEQERAFERFYRATAARDGAIQGLGVGLSIAQQIIDAHGGDVRLSSAPGRGTSVTVNVPLSPVLAAT